MKAIIKGQSSPAKNYRRQWLWFLLLWGAGVLVVAGFAYGLRALLDPLLGT